MGPTNDQGIEHVNRGGSYRLLATTACHALPITVTSLMPPNNRKKQPYDVFQSQILGKARYERKLKST